MRGFSQLARVTLLAGLVAGCSSAPPPVSDATMQAAVHRASAEVARASTASAPQFADNDPHPWDGRTPWHYPVHGIDISKWQGEVDWRTTRAAGVSFAYIKATEGGDHVDDLFRHNWHNAAAAGMPRGAYHYYYFCRPAAEQAAWFIDQVPRDASALPPVLDVEWTHRSQTCRFRPDPAHVRAEMVTYLRLVGSYYGKRPMVYTTVDFYRDNELWRVDGHHFWLRSVADHPSGPYPGQTWALWQYTGTGLVPGIRGNTDLNAFAGSPADWLRFRTGG